MTKKSEAEWGVAADAIQTVFGHVGDLSDRVSAQVGELIGFDVAPDLLGGIEVRSVAGEWLDTQPIALARNAVQQAAAAM